MLIKGKSDKRRKKDSGTELPARVELLEPRLLFSADTGIVADSAHPDLPPDNDSSFAGTFPQPEDRPLHTDLAEVNISDPSGHQSAFPSLVEHKTTVENTEVSASDSLVDLRSSSITDHRDESATEPPSDEGDRRYQSSGAITNQSLLSANSPDRFDIDSPAYALNQVEPNLPASPDSIGRGDQRDIVFIDGSVYDYDLLVSDLVIQSESDPEIIILNADDDGVTQITNVLAERINVSAIHIVSHGVDGAVTLGNSILSVDNLDQHEYQLRGWKSSLVDGSDLLFYGCNLAASDSGEALLEAIGALCGCDVAASDDLTGHESLGGDWELEYVIGDVETPSAFSVQVQSGWVGTLDITSNLAAYYEFEENGGGTATDSTANNNDGSWINAPGWNSDSAIGSFSLDFGGDTNNSNAVVSVADAPSLDFSGDFSVAFWYNATVAQDNGTRIVGSHDGSDGFSIFANANGTLSMFVQGSANSYTETRVGGLMADGSWHHVVATNTSGTLRLYVDNSTSGSSGGTTGTVDPAAPLTIGGENATIGDFEGKLDDIRVYTRALSASDVSELYNYTGSGPQTFTVTNTSDSGAGSLRQAIIDANANVGADTIEFDIAGIGTQVINLSTALDTITDEVFIDGTTQTGWIEGTFLPIVIDGNNGAFDGLTFSATADSSEVHGLVVRDYGQDAIQIDAGASGITVAGNWIGRYSSDGTITAGEDNGGAGILVLGDGNTIGGTTAANRNVIHDSSYAGSVALAGAASMNNTVAGNYFGTTIDGNAAIEGTGNYAGYGVYVYGGANSNTIGGATDNHRNIFGGVWEGVGLYHEDGDNNVVQNNWFGLGADGSSIIYNEVAGVRIDDADNTLITDNIFVGAVNGHGVQIDSGTDGTTIQGNYFGTDETQTLSAGNFEGVDITSGGTNITIGGIGAGEGNVFTNQPDEAIEVGNFASGVTIRGNSIYGNEGLGIDHGDDGVTANDAGDSDTGANNLQNWAAINSVSIADNGTFSYDIDTTTLASGTYTIDFYVSRDRDLGRVEGERYIGSLNGVADGNSSLTGTLAGISMAPGEFVTLVTTDDASGSSSEFSQYGYASDGDGDGVTPDLQTTATSGGGLSINEDGGNDVYLQADDGTAILGGRTQFSTEFQFTSASSGEHTFLSYRDSEAADANDEVLIRISAGNLLLRIDNVSATSTAMDYRTLADGTPHTIGTTWSNSGDWEVFVDGVSVDSGSGLKVGHTLESNGRLVVGQDQTTGGVVDSADDRFVGVLHDARIFSDVRTAVEMAASYRSDLPYDEAGMIANWTFDQLSSDGIITESVTGNNLTVMHTSQSGFTASEASLTYSLDENAINGTVVGSVEGIDPQREAQIASLLAADPDLRYSAETGKFYKLVQTNVTWVSANTSALGTDLEGISGQLGTIRSAAEQALFMNFQGELSDEIWLGGSDATVEGEWRWQKDGNDADQFWDGPGVDSGGYRSDRAYENWRNTTEPNDFGGAEDYVLFSLSNNGGWNDSTSTTTASYVIEWNASEVLSNYAFEFTDQVGTDGPLFTVDSSTGELRLATPTEPNSFSDHVVQIDASNNSSVTESGGFISNIADDTATGNDAFQTTGAVEPQLASGAINGLDAILFDGVNDHLRIANDATINTVTHEDKTVTVVLQSGLDTSARQVIYEQGGESKGLNIYIDGDQLYAGVWSDNVNFENQFLSTSIDQSQTYVVSLTFDAVAGNVALYVNGAQADIAQITDSLEGQSREIAIGATRDYSNFHDGTYTGSTAHYFSGMIGELNHHNVGFNSVEMVALHAHLMNKWLDTPTSLDYEAATSHDVELTVTDAAGNSYSETMSIAVDNEIEAAQTVPAAQTINEDATLTFTSGTATEVSVTDTVGGTDSRMRVTLTVNDGVLNLAQTTGLMFVEGANNSASFVIDGTESDINAALDGMTFTPHANFNGSVTLDMTTALSADLDGHYTFEGGNADDHSAGTSYDGTFNGDAATTTDGTRGDVLQLDGTDDYVEINSLFNNSQTTTLSAWINPTAIDTSGSDVISIGDNVVLRINFDGHLGGLWRSGGAWYQIYADVDLVGAGWQHVAYTVDSNNDVHTLYLNGQAIETGIAALPVDYDLGTTTRIGANANLSLDFDFIGLIDDARIYDRALSADEIGALAADQAETSNSVAITVNAVNDAPTFDSGDGIITEDFGDVGTVFVASQVLPNGKILTAGTDWGTSDTVVLRYNPDGSLDTAFDGDGIARHSIADFGVNAMTVAPDGKIVLTGYDNANGDVAVVRLNADGSFDTSFGGGDGITTTDVNGFNDDAADVVVQNDGKVIIGGYAGATASTNAERDFLIIRYNADGTLDSSFGSGGIVVNAVSSEHDEVKGLTLQADSKLLVAGHSEPGNDEAFTLLRYNANGTLDTSFGGGDGIVTTELGSSFERARDVLILDDGKILLTGNSSAANNDVVVVRYTADGVLDLTYGGGDGIANLPGFNGTGHKAALQSDGKLVVSAYSNDTLDRTIVRFNTGGTLDTTFGGSGTGLVTINTPTLDDFAYDIDVQDDDKIVITGEAYNRPDYTEIDGFVYRLTADGELDQRFNLVNTLDGNPTFIEDGSAVVLDDNVRVFDTDIKRSEDTFENTTLTLVRNGGANSDDVFSETGLLGVLTDGGNLIYNSVTVGTVTTNSGGTLLLTFNAATDNAAINNVMQAIAYSNSSDAPPASVQIDWNFNDHNDASNQGSGGDEDVSGSTTVNITAADNDPVTDAHYTTYIGGNEFIVNTETTGNQDRGNVTALADGGFVVVWESEGQDGDNEGIYFQRYDAAGNAIGGETPVNTTTAGIQDDPEITALASGGFVVVWESFGQDTDGEGSYLRVFDADGVATTAETLVNTTTAENQDAPNIASLSGGGFVVAWESYLQDGDLNGIYFQRFNDSGVAQGSETIVNTTTSGEQSLPRINGTNDGGFVVAWYDESSGDSEVKAQRFDSSGAAVGGELSINTFTSGDQDDPDVVALSGGGFVVVWESNGQDGDGNGIYGQLFTDAGVASGSEFVVNSTTISAQQDHRIEALDDGGFVVVWEANGDQDSDGAGAYAQQFDAAGNKVNGEFQLNTTTASGQSNPDVAVLNDGRLVPVWESDLQDGSNDGVVGRLFTPALNENSPVGTVAAVASQIVDADGNNSGTYTYTLTDDAGGAFDVQSDGSITVRDPGLIDFENASTMTVTVRVSEASSSSLHDEVVVINLNNLAESVQTVPGAQTIDEDTTLTFSNGNGNAVSVTDTLGTTDARMRVTLSVNDGVLTLSQTTGLTFVEGANGSGSLVIDGTESDINAALDGMTFTPDVNVNRSVSLSMNTELAAGLNAHLTFEGGNANDQAQGTTYNGTLNGDATIVTDSDRGEVLSLDGDQDFVQINGLMGEPESLTASSWINATNVDPGGSDIFNIGSNVIVRVNVDSTFGATHYDGTSFNNINSGINLVGAGWQHVAYTYDSVAGTQSLYLNGQLVAEETVSGSIVYSGDPETYIGKRGAGNSWDFHGMIDDARIYSRALSADEIAAVATTQAVPSANLDGLYTFAGGNADDQSDGTTQDGTLIGDATTVIDPDRGEVLSLDGTGDSVQISGLFGEPADITTTAWVKSTPGASSSVISLGDSFAIRLAFNNEVIAFYKDAGYWTTINTGVILDSNWNHVAASFNDVTREFAVHVNGEQVASQTVTDSIQYNRGVDTFIGQHGDGGNDFFAGLIDDVRVYTRHLSTSEIATLANHREDGVAITVSPVNDAPTFAVGDGTTSENFTGPFTTYFATHVLPNGQILTVGADWGGATDSSVLARYNADGSLDTSFGGGNGYADLADAWGEGLTVQPDGKILVTGFSWQAGTTDVLLMRFNADGTLDTTFGGGDGITLTDVNGFTDIGAEVVMQDDGKIVVGGYANNGGTALADSDFLVLRFDADGSLDTTFGGGNGYVNTAFSADADYFASVTIQSDGKILAAGRAYNGTDSDWALVRYNTDGTLDTSFGGGDGILLTNHSSSTDAASSVIALDDGKIIVSGYSNAAGEDHIVARYNSDGTLDITFGGGDGFATSVDGVGRKAVVQPDGRILVVGVDDGAATDLVVVRYNTDGTLDTSFGGGAGFATADVRNGGPDYGYDIFLQDDGRIVVTGESYAPADFSNSDGIVVRFNSDGTLDDRFSLAKTLNGNPTFVEDGAAVLLDDDVEIYDEEIANGVDTFENTTLTLSRNGGATSEDVFSESGLLGTLTEGSNLVYNSVTVGTVTTSSSGTLLLTFNAAADNDAVNNVMQAIAYSNSSDAPPANVQINWSFNDHNDASNQGSGGDLVATGSTTVDITAVNDAPVIDATNLLVNGDLETGDLTGWTTTGTVSNSGNALRFGEFNDAGPHTAEQSFTTVIGQTYTLKFQYRDDSGSLNQQMQITVDGATNNLDVTRTTSTPGSSYGSYEYTFVADSTTSTLTFTDVSPSSISVDGFIDNVSVTEQPTFTQVSEDDVNNAGNTVASLLASVSGDLVTDGDAGAVEGIAITDASSAFDYSIDGGATWQRVDNVSTFNALLLRSTDLIRFVPNEIAAQSENIEFRAWDQTSGTEGDYVSTASNGSSTAFSTEIESASIVTTDVNDGPSFGSEGGFAVGYGEPGYSQNQASLTLADGSVLFTPYDDSSNSIIGKLSPDGQLDVSFGDDGYFEDSSLTYIRDIKEQSDGKFLVTGNVGSDIGLARYNADGMLDNTFGTSGVVVTNVGGGDDAYEVAVHTDGTIVVVGDNGGDSLVLRFTSAGVPDNTFSGDGIFTVSLGGSFERLGSVSILPDGRILAAGEDHVIRLTTAGVLDTTFDGDGILAVGHKTNSVVVQANGDIAVTGLAGDDLAVTRFDSNGALDTGFGVGGTATWTDPFVLTSYGIKIIQQTDGRLLVAGTVETNSTFGYEMAVVRFNTDGTLDTSFGGGDGSWLSGLTNDYVEGYDISLFNDSGEEKIVIGGYDSQFGFSRATIARLNADGTLDTTYQSGQLDGNPTFTEGGPAVVLDGNVQIFDRELSVDDDFTDATLTLARNGGANANDQFSFEPMNGVGLAIETSGGPLEYFVTKDGNKIAELDYDVPGQITLTFIDTDGRTPSQSDVNDVIQQINYQNSSDAPLASVQVDWTFSDGNTGEQGSGGDEVATGNTTVDITATNDAPVVAVTVGDVNFTEQNPVGIDVGATISDIDNTTLTGAVVRISANYEVGVDQLQFTNQNGISGTYDNATGILTLTGTASVAEYQTAFRSIVFNNASDNPSTATRTIQWLVNDGDADSVAVTRDTTFSSVNDDPTNAGSLPSDVTVTEDLLSHVDLSAVDFNDVDAGSSSLTLMLTTSTGGELTLAADGSLTFGGTATARTITGSLADLNTYFNTASNIQYQHSTQHMFGDDADTINVVINDNGNTGSGGGTDQNLGTVNVDITAVNDEEVLATNTGTMVAEGSTGNTITTAMLETTDVDNTDAQLVYTVDAVTANGMLRLSGTALGVNDTFTQADIDAGNVTYDHDGSQTTDDSFNFTVDDGAGTNTSSTFNFIVTNVNDAPVNTVPGAQTVDEDTAIAITDISVADEDDNLSTVQLSVNDGTLNVTLSGAASVSAGANDSNDVTLSGSLVDINATLATLSYQGNQDFNGSDTLTVLSTDSDSATDSDTVVITVDAINDDPANVGSLASDVTVTEDVSSNIDLSAIDLSDVDAGGSNLEVTLTTSAGGDLSALAGSGITIGGSSTALTLTGSQADLNAYLNTVSNVSYLHGTQHTFGNDADTINVVVNDLGNTGNGGGADQNLGTVNVDITAVNDEEVLAINTGTTVAEGSTGNTITTAMLETTDVDNTDTQLVYTVDAVTANGTLRLSGTALGVNDTFTQADVDAGNVTYDHDGSQTTSDSFDFTVDDGAGTNTSSTFNFIVTNVNDAPVNTVPGAQTVDEDTAIAITGISVADDDNNLSTVQLSVNDGTLNVTLSGAATVSGGANDSNDLTLSGSLVDINATLASLNYQGNSNFNGSDTLTVLSTDGGATIDSDTVSIIVDAVNDTPEVAGPVSVYSVNEQTSLSIEGTGFSVTDSDAASGTMAAAISVVEGYITIAEGDSGVTISSGNGTGTVVFSGTVTQIDALLTGAGTGTITFFNSSDTPSASTNITVTVNDGGNTGSDPGLTADAVSEEDSTSQTINLNADNDAPALTNLGGDTLNYNEADGAVVIEQGANAVVSDVDSPDFNTGTLTVTISAGGDPVEDVIAIRNQGMGAGQVGISGSDVTFGATVVGTFSGGTGSTPLTVTWNANSTPLAVTRVVQNITYENNDILDSTGGARTVDFVVTDGDGGTTSTHTSIVNVNSINNAPTIVNLSGDTLAYMEGDGQQVIEQSGDALAADVDSTDFDTGTLTVTFTAGDDSAEDTLGIDNQGTGAGQIGVSGSTITFEGTTIGSFTGGSAGNDMVVAFNAAADTIAVSALINAISYENTDTDNPVTTTRTVTYVLTDGDGGSSLPATATISVTGVNDAPVIASATGAGTYIEGAVGTYFDAGLTLFDIDSIDLDGGVLHTAIVAGVDSHDRLQLRDGNNVTVTTGSSVQYDFGSGPVTIATVSGAPGSITVTFNATATVASAEAVARQVAFHTDTDDPTQTQRTIEMQLTDGDGGVSNTVVRGMNVTAVNDLPVLSNIENTAISYVENQLAVPITASLTLADVDDTMIDSATVTISSGYVADEDYLSFSDTAQISAVWNAGTLTLSGPDSVTAYEQALRSVSYSNSSEHPDTSMRTLTITINDGTGDSTGVQRQLDIVSVNDDPTNSGSLPGNQVGLEDIPLSIDLSGLNLTDVDAANDAVTLRIASAGSLSTANTTDLLVTGDAGASLELTGTLTHLNQWLDSASGLTYTPPDQLHGTALDQLTISVNDNGHNGMGGGLDVPLGSVQIDIASVNDQPTGADTTRTFNEDETYTFTVADFGYSDPFDNDNFLQVEITQVPANGEMRLAGSLISAGTVVGVADITAGALRYTPNANGHGVLWDDLRFSVQDDGGTANGGVDQDLTDHTIAFTVNSVNDAPIASNLNVSTLEDTDIIIRASDFGFNDVIDGDQLEWVIIDAVPTHGTLLISGVLVSAGQPVSVTDINADVLVYRPDTDVYGIDEIGFRVVDDGGVDNGGDNLSADTYTLSIDVTGVNDAPTGVANTITVDEDTEYRFSPEDFGFNDIHDQSDRLAAVLIDVWPDKGTLTLSGQVGFGAVTVADLINGELRYLADTDASGVAYSSFTFRVQDDNTQAGPDTDVSTRTMTIDVISVSDAPGGQDQTVQGLEDSDYVIGLADFGFSDNRDDDELVAVIIDELPRFGSVLLEGSVLNSSVLNSSVLDAGIAVASSDITSGLLVYRPSANYHGIDTLQFRLQDTGQLPDNDSGQLDNISDQNTLTFDIIAVNDAPSGSDNTISTNEDSVHTFARIDFGFSDPGDSDDNHQFSAITIVSLPEIGSLTVAGADAFESQVVSVAEIDSGALQYQPPQNETGMGYRGFGFQVHDSGGTENGGENIDPLANQLNFDLPGVNDSPLLLSNGATVAEGGTIVIDRSMLYGADPDDPNPEDLALTITRLPDHGELRIGGEIVRAGDQFSLQAILDQALSYRHDESETSEDNFEVALTDGGEDDSQTAIGAFELNITEVIDPAPVVDADQLELTFGESFDSNSGDLLASGHSGLNNNAYLNTSQFDITMEVSPNHGTVTLNSDGTFIYIHDGSRIYEDEFRYRVTNEDGIYTIATVSIVIEPPLNAAFGAEVPAPTTSTTSTNPIPTTNSVPTTSSATDIEENASESVGDKPEKKLTAEPTQAGPVFATPVDATRNSTNIASIFAIREAQTLSAQTQSLEHYAAALPGINQHKKIDTILLNADGLAPISAATLDILFEVKVPTSKVTVENSYLLDGLSQLDNDLNDAASDKRLKLSDDIVLGASLSMSIGLLAWAMRGGAIFASLMGAAPLWWGLDLTKTIAISSKKPNAEDSSNQQEQSHKVEGMFD